jgi:ribosome maturation factor RimP
MKKIILPALSAIIEETVKSCNVELYDAEFKGRFLRIWITSPGGVTIDMCADLSNKLSLRLDMENLINDRYFLEVSSPGIERKLRNYKDFQSAVNKTVSVSTRLGNFKGIVLSVNDEGIFIKNIKGSSGKPDTEQSIRYCDINNGRIIVSDDELFAEKPRDHSQQSIVNSKSLAKRSS